MKVLVIIGDFNILVDVYYSGCKPSYDHPGDPPEWDVITVLNGDSPSDIETFYFETGMDEDQLHQMVCEEYANELEYQRFEEEGDTF